MAIVVSCPHCGQKLNAPSSAVGRSVKCSGCQAVFTLRAPAPKPSARIAFRFTGSRLAVLVLGLKAALALCLTPLMLLPVALLFGPEGKAFKVAAGIYGVSFLCLSVALSCWVAAAVCRHVLCNTVVVGTARGDVTLRFQFTGLDVARLALHAIVASATLLLYSPWFLVEVLRLITEKTTGVAEDGTTYRIDFSASGLELLGPVAGGLYLTLFTWGLYTPFFVLSLIDQLARRSKLLENNAPIGEFRSHATGKDYFLRFLADTLLAAITLGIYGCWAAVNLKDYVASNFDASVRGRVYTGEYSGTGGDHLLLILKAYLLTIITLGLYLLVVPVDGMAYDCEHTEFVPGRGEHR
jgi:uncharacterized membrane protein YjgN (DUF898 family)